MIPRQVARAESNSLTDFARVMSVPRPTPPGRIALNEENVKNGLGKLVLTLVELLRELLERQAIRRIEAGALTEEDAERLAVALMKLSEQMECLKNEFGLDDEDLNVDLGPLGKLL